MTLDQMEVIRQQTACLECQRKREAEIDDLENLNQFTSRSAVASGNILNCDNCLRLIEIRFRLLHDSQVARPEEKP